MTSLGSAPDYTQLAFHTLAHYPIAGPASLYDPAYLAWSRATLPDGARTPIERDASLVVSLHARDPHADALQSLPELFQSIAQLCASGARDLAELDSEDVADPHVLEMLQKCGPLAELVRVDMLLAATEFAEAFPSDDDAVIALGPVLDEARKLHAPLKDARVELARALGVRGRAFAHRIVVGVPGDARTIAVLAMHEASVRAKRSDYVRSEWAALVEVARSVHDSAFEAAHAAWLATLDLTALCTRASELGLAPPELVDRIAKEPLARAALFVQGI